jgi:thioredoxin reductase (NADPH)
MARYEVVIIGGGPAGLTAGLYTARSGLKSLLIERGMFGGQMVNAKQVENYPGFPEGVSGFDLGSAMHRQAVQYGLEIMTAEVTQLVAEQPFRVLTTEQDLEADAIIVATGSEYRRLGVPGEDRLLGRGVSYCATCDGFLFRDQEVAVVGGGDTAIADALELGQHTRKAYVIHRRDQLRASQVLQKRAFSQPGMEFIWDTVVDEILGEGKVESLRLRNVRTGETSSLEVDGVFVAVGLKPNSQCFVDLLELSETGHVVTDDVMATSVRGIFAAGDIRHKSARQIATAVGDGAAAAMSIFRYIRG